MKSSYFFLLDAKKVGAEKREKLGGKKRKAAKRLPIVI
jgi:hypothetical protein